MLPVGCGWWFCSRFFRGSQSTGTSPPAAHETHVCLPDVYVVFRSGNVLGQQDIEGMSDEGPAKVGGF